MTSELKFRPAHRADEPALQEILCAAFKPVFSSFRQLLGDEIYEIAQKPEDDQQPQWLSSMLRGEGNWQIFVAELDSIPVGFISLLTSSETEVGEIGLNAVAPIRSGNGFGTEMYKFAISKFRQAGMKVAVVSTGADRSHQFARNAYRKAGFSVEVPSVWMCCGLQ